MKNTHAIENALLDATTKTPKAAFWTRELDLSINWEKQISHTWSHATVAQEIARIVLKLHWLQIDPERFVWWKIEIDVNPTVLLEALRNAEKVNELTRINWEQISQITDLKRKLEERTNLIPVEPQENDVFYRDNELGEITYWNLWKRLRSEWWISIFINLLDTKDKTEQLNLLQHMHRFKIPKEKISTSPSTIFECKSKGKSEKTQKIKNRLNWPIERDSLERVSVSWLFENATSRIIIKDVMKYCLYCYAAGIQLKP